MVALTKEAESAKRVTAAVKLFYQIEVLSRKLGTIKYKLTHEEYRQYAKRISN